MLLTAVATPLYASPCVPVLPVTAVGTVIFPFDFTSVDAALSLEHHTFLVCVPFAVVLVCALPL